MNFKKIFIAGIPGTGKTRIGNELQAEGFHHVDIESGIYDNELQDNCDAFLKSLSHEQRDTVITWGFPVDDFGLDIVQKIKANGFKVIWFDGDRDAALREFKQRQEKKNSESLPNDINNFHAQVQSIDRSNIISKIQPAIINTFSRNQTFKNVKKIIEEIKENV